MFITAEDVRRGKPEPDAYLLAAERLDVAAAGTLYLASTQMAQTYGALMVRTTGNPARLAGSVREAVLRVEPRIVEPTSQTLASQRSESIGRPRFNSLLFGALSALALILAAVGLLEWWIGRLLRRRARQAPLD